LSTQLPVSPLTGGVALRLVWMTLSKMAPSVEPVGVRPEMPALAQTMSSFPKSLATAAKRRIGTAVGKVDFVDSMAMVRERGLEE
jgi:hypothetical protein